MSAKRSPEKAGKTKSASKKLTADDFHNATFDTLWHAQWGNFYDQELIDVLIRLEDAERCARMDFKALHGMIESEELRLKFGDHETALANLQAVRDEFWAVKDRISKERGNHNVFGIIAMHSVRASEWGVCFKDANPEVAITAWLALLLCEIENSIPGPRLIKEAIEALKEMGPLFDGETKPEAKSSLWQSVHAIPVRAMIEAWAKLRHPDAPELWVRFCKKMMLDTAKFIHDENLFSGEIRINEILSDNPVLFSTLKSSGSSRSFFGR